MLTVTLRQQTVIFLYLTHPQLDQRMAERPLSFIPSIHLLLGKGEGLLEDMSLGTQQWWSWAKLNQVFSYRTLFMSVLQGLFF